MDASGSLPQTLGQTDTCPDCIERDDVDLLGEVRRGRYGRVAQCAGCNIPPKRRGDGRVPRTKVDVVAWWVAQKERVS